jgi:hypothetical protein
MVISEYANGVMMMVQGGWCLLAGMRKLLGKTRFPEVIEQISLQRRPAAACAASLTKLESPEGGLRMEGNSAGGMRAVEQSCLILNFFSPLAFSEASVVGIGMSSILANILMCVSI